VDNYQVEVLLTLALAMASYAVANAVGASGPIAVVVAGVFIGNRGRGFAMSETTRQHLDNFWELIDETLNAVLFLLVGLEVLVLQFNMRYLVAGGVAIIVVLISRWASVAGCVGLISLGGTPRRGQITVLTWGGLRGGLSVAMALSLPEGNNRNLILVVTYAVVVFCIFVQGLTAGRVIKWAVRSQPA
jgi:CPA1 family monovalent cation:H+ antiporter